MRQAKGGSRAIKVVFSAALVSLATTACRPNPRIGHASLLTVAVANPPVLLPFRHGDPAGCRDPDKLLREIDQSIHDSPPPRCVSNVVTVEGGALLLELSCVLPDPDPEDPNQNCTIVYSGSIWSERYLNTTDEYDLRAVGWLRKSCGNRRSYTVDRALQLKVNESGRVVIEKVLSKCREGVKT